MRCVGVNDDFKQKVMRLAYKYFEYAYERQEYIYEDESLHIAVAVIDNVLVIEDNRFYHVHIVFCRDNEEARKLANIFVELYKLQHDMRVDYFIYSFADRIITFFHHPRLFRVYQSRNVASNDGE